MKRSALFLAITVLLSACGGGGEGTSTGKDYVKPTKGSAFSEPDINNDFCGVHINYQYCKCAFHGEYCNAIDMDKRSANAYVAEQFGAYIADLLKEFSDGCKTQNGYVQNKTCYVCPEGAIPDGQQCKVEKSEEGDLQSGSPMKKPAFF